METQYSLPGLNCGMCGNRTCEEFSSRLRENPDLLKRCLPLSKDTLPTGASGDKTPDKDITEASRKESGWRDSLGREFDFILEHFPEDPGPREVIIPRNPMLTRELDINQGETLIGRPLGMSCGCPITHCGIAMKVERSMGVIVWCVTGPLQPRKSGYKDLGYYSAEAYEGIIREARCEIKIGMRYFFQPRMCMLQWRHSGLVNYMNKTAEGIQVRLEGLWIG